MATLDQQGILQIVSMIVQLLVGLHNQGTITGQTDLVNQLKDAHATLQAQIASGDAPSAAAPAPAPQHVDALLSKLDEVNQNIKALFGQKGS